MYSHFTLGTNDVGRAERFYTPVLETLGQVPRGSVAQDGYLLFGLADGSFPHIFIYHPFDGLPATWGNGCHIAFNAPSCESVDAFYQAAMSHGGLDEGAPGCRPEYAADYYGAYVRDPDGNKLQAVCYTNGRSCGPIGNVISHITIGLGDLARERTFYTSVLDVLGVIEKPDDSDDVSIGYGLEGTELPALYVQRPFDGRAATWGNGTHTAFKAATKDAVHAFHKAALANGGSCDGPPGPRPEYSANYYAAYVRDPVGNKLQAVCREPR